MNTVHDFLRKRKNFVSDEGIIDTIAVSGGPVEALLTGEKEVLVRKALASIPIKYRTAVVLKDIDGLSYIEISKILRCNIGTVESRIYRGRHCLILFFGFCCNGFVADSSWESIVRNSATQLRNTQKAICQINYSLQDYYDNNHKSI